MTANMQFGTCFIFRCALSERKELKINQNYRFTDNINAETDGSWKFHGAVGNFDGVKPNGRVVKCSWVKFK
jgi:hypothetical protein